MANFISHLAHVDPEAKIGDNVTIHPFAFISKNTEIGDGCTIYPYVSILSGSRIGKNNKIYNGAIIGAEPQDFQWNGEPTLCYIGDNNVIREQTIINRSATPEGATRIGNNCFIMAETHISHDAQVSNNVVLGNGAQLAGNVKVHSHTILSSGAMAHAGSDIGRWSMIKGGCRISGNVPPYVVIAHNPASFSGVNAYLMRNHGFSEETIDNVAKCYRHIYQSGTSVFNGLRRIKEDVAPCNERDNIIRFLENHRLQIVAANSQENVLD